MSLQEEDILELIKARQKRKQEFNEQNANTGRSAMGVLGDIVLGVGAGFGDAMGAKMTAKDILGIRNANRDKRLKALDSEDGLKEIMDLYKIGKNAELAKEMAKMREAGQDSRLLFSQGSNDARLAQTLGAQDQRQRRSIKAAQDKFEIQTANQKLKENLGHLSGAQKSLIKSGYKFADEAASNRANKEALDRLKDARYSTSMRGPLGHKLGEISSFFGVESPEFARFESLSKDAVSRLVKERSGVAASEKEMARLEKVLPKLKQRDATFDAVAEEVIKTADDIIRARRDEYLNMAAAELMASVPDPQARTQAIERILNGEDAVAVLESIKDQYRGSGYNLGAGAVSRGGLPDYEKPSPTPTIRNTGKGGLTDAEKAELERLEKIYGKGGA